MPPAPSTGAESAQGATGTLLYQLVLATGATQVLACGLAAGSRTVPIAAALCDNGRGRVVSCQPDAARALSVSAALEQAGLAAYADVLEGDAQDVLPCAPGPVDLLVLDGPAERFLAVLRAMEPRLLPGAMVVACGAQDSLEQSADFLAHVRSPDSGYVSLPLLLDGGLEMAVRAL
ncbi:class I SAM-dependent methyltransferase [Streptomyces sp. NPDC051162]|uniref:O-methyltransferase n=1 Tax=Streptomyces sp. NPDC051162 TaxID=3154747 RepID=UPI0034193A91